MEIKKQGDLENSLRLLPHMKNFLSLHRKLKTNNTFSSWKAKRPKKENWRKKLKFKWKNQMKTIRPNRTFWLLNSSPNKETRSKKYSTRKRVLNIITNVSIILDKRKNRAEIKASKICPSNNGHWITQYKIYLIIKFTKRVIIINRRET